MKTVRDLFLEEAGASLSTLRAELAGEAPDAGTMHEAVRRIRGAAQMARFGELAHRALAVEHELRAWAGTTLDDERIRRGWAIVDVFENEVQRVRSGDIRSDAPTESHMEEQATRHGEEIVELELLEYHGSRALDRAEALREPLERAIDAHEPTGGLIDELFDLIRLART